MISRASKIAMVVGCLFSFAAFGYQGDTPQTSATGTSIPATSTQTSAPPQAQTNPPANANAGSHKSAKAKSSVAQPAKKSAAAIVKKDPNQPPAIPSALVGLDENSGPEKTVIRNGGTQDIRLQLSPTSTPEQIAIWRRQTHELLGVSTDNLKKIAQLQLDANQQDMLEQVHNYMNQAKVADKSGELQRAQMLASKARQLSDDLVGARIFPKIWPW
jgi:hypothetical protein